MSLYETKERIRKYDLVVSEESDFDLTEGKVYVVMDYDGGYLIHVKNDAGHVLQYTTEYFRMYKGETV